MSTYQSATFTLFRYQTFNPGTDDFGAHNWGYACNSAYYHPEAKMVRVLKRWMSELEAKELIRKLCRDTWNGRWIVLEAVRRVFKPLVALRSDPRWRRARWKAKS